jgi:DNA-binding FadR family transcriptional regulator
MTRGSLVQRITDHLRRRIVSGDLPVGRRLPSMRKLAALYGVSLPTMHATINALAALGLVRISHGVGVFVARPRSHAALLNHAWQQASPTELGLMRAAIDRDAPIIVAKIVQRGPDARLPGRLSELNFLAHERSSHRHDWPEDFLRADLEFHRAIASSIRGSEIVASLYARLGSRLIEHLMPVADLQAGDAELHEAHVAMSTAILDGRPISAGRLAHAIARRELRSLGRTLG